MKRRKEEYFQSEQHVKAVNTSATHTMQVATIIWQDIMVHVFGMDPSHQNVVWGTTDENQPAFGFMCKSEDADKLEKFIQTFSRVTLKPDDNVWAFDLKNRAIMLNTANLTNDLIRGFLASYGGQRLTPEKIQPQEISSKRISPEDIKYIDNRPFLGEMDFQLSFKEAIGETGKTIFRHFTYSLNDLDRAIRAFELDHDGITGYSVDEVFRIQ